MFFEGAKEGLKDGCHVSTVVLAKSVKPLVYSLELLSSRPSERYNPVAQAKQCSGCICLVPSFLVTCITGPVGAAAALACIVATPFWAGYKGARDSFSSQEMPTSIYMGR